MFSLIRIELYKIFSRIRTYIGFIAIGLLVPLIQVALFIDGETYIEFSLQNLKEAFDFQGNLLNGYLACYIILATLYVHIPFLITLVTGDLLAGEAAGGTFRVLLTRPVSRTKLLFAKFISGLIYTAALIFWMALISLLLGIAIMGTGDLIVIKNTVYIFAEDDVLWRLLAAFGFGLIAMWCVASLSFMFSSFADNSIGPIILTMTVIISFIVISAIDLSLFRVVKPFLFTNYMGSWKLFFETPVNYDKILMSAGALIAHIILFFGIAWYNFKKKDILT
ncbi:MAG: ABC-2 family transporter protein [Bacteroidetes bacterium ADurb.Bin397]|jgi:ABC-2 type transport system permease protein|nr:MAG: ABC-2 family transporter protein [Bacteroidetes bacterium ADurb.Bin397]